SAIDSVARLAIPVSRMRCQLSQAAEDWDPAGGSDSELLRLMAFVCANDSEADAAAANAAPDPESVSGADCGCHSVSRAGSGFGVGSEPDCAWVSGASLAAVACCISSSSERAASSEVWATFSATHRWAGSCCGAGHKLDPKQK